MGDTTDLVIAQRPRPEIERAMQFIVEHLERRFTVADVAGAIGLSEFHLHRLLHTAVGESVGRFFTRKRLELAALRLAYEPHTPITTIALESGYSSSSNFSKAFSGSRNESRAATTAGDEGGDNLARRRLRLAQ